MREVLASRSWKGRDWKLRVGELHTTFDEEDVELLIDQVGDEHAVDSVGRTRKVASDTRRKNIWGTNVPPQINSLPRICPDCTAEQWEAHSNTCPHYHGTCPDCGVPAGSYHDAKCSRYRPPINYGGFPGFVPIDREETFGVAPRDIEAGELIDVVFPGGYPGRMRRPPTRYGVKLDYNDPDRLRELRAIMHGGSGEIECSVVMPCCKKTKQVRFPMPQSNTIRSKVSHACDCGQHVQLELELGF